MKLPYGAVLVKVIAAALAALALLVGDAVLIITENFPTDNNPWALMALAAVNAGGPVLVAYLKSESSKFLQRGEAQ